MPQVELSGWVKDQLDKIKDKEQHKSYDSVVRMLLREREVKESG